MTGAFKPVRAGLRRRDDGVELRLLAQHPSGAAFARGKWWQAYASDGSMMKGDMPREFIGGPTITDAERSVERFERRLERRRLMADPGNVQALRYFADEPGLFDRHDVMGRTSDLIGVGFVDMDASGKIVITEAGRTALAHATERAASSEQPAVTTSLTSMVCEVLDRAAARWGAPRDYTIDTAGRITMTPEEFASWLAWAGRADVADEIAECAKLANS